MVTKPDDVTVVGKFRRMDMLKRYVLVVSAATLLLRSSSCLLGL
jgi:hypothetical protein